MEEDDIGSMLNGLSRKYQQKYGIAVFSVDAKKTEKGFELSGIVLTGNQKEETFDLISSSGIKISGEKISVLSDQKQRDEIGWGVVKPKIADLRSRFVSNKIMNSVILKRIRCSQAFESETLRILYKNEDQFLVQQSDLTLGWINKNEVISKRENLYKKWENGIIFLQNKTVQCTIPIEIVVKEAEKFLGTKYVFGGKSMSGIDCSGLVQVAYKNALNIILPKHSWDQKRFGKVVELKEVKTGDLVFLIKNKNSHKHVGIVEKKGAKINLIHASLD
ncbi:MAG: NlpC/P60 family protein, partial [Minisyncoccia bacterium]